jgi:hypothetical protein
MATTFVESKVNLDVLIKDLQGIGTREGKIAQLREALDTLDAEIEEHIHRGGVEEGLIEDRDFLRQLMDAAVQRAREEQRRAR